MKAITVVCRIVQVPRRADAVGASVVVLALLMAAAAVRTCAGDDAVSLQVTDTPAATLRIVGSEQAPGDAASDEIWIGSDEPGPDQPARPESAPDEPGPASETLEQSAIRVLTTENATGPAAALASRATGPKPAQPASTTVEPPSALPAALEMPTISSLPRAPAFRRPVWTTPARIRPLAAPAQRLTEAGASASSEEPRDAGTIEPARQIVAASSGEGRDPARPSDAEKPGPEDVDTLRARAATSDEALFRTTSRPAKPAAMVFRPAARPARVGAAPGLMADATAAIRVPAGPTDEPDIRQSRVTAGFKRSFPKATGPSEAFFLAVRRSKTLHTKLDVSRAAVADASVCEVVQRSPRAISIVGKSQGTTQMTLWFRDGSHQPVTCPIRVAANPQSGPSGRF
jgi:pilus assembly protein CpaC